MADEVIRLLLDLGVSAANAQAVAEKLDSLKSAATAAAASYDVLERQVGQYEVSARKSTYVTLEERAALAAVEKAARAQDDAMDKVTRSAMEATRAQQLMRDALDDTAHATHVVNTAATGAVGTKTAGGRGLLGFSYAFQDFSSVLSQGGANSLPRAMGAIANNIDMMAMAAGASVKTAAALSLGFMGLTLAAPALVSAFKGIWDAMAGGESFEATKERLKEIEAEVRKVHDSFLKMIQAPTDHEKEAAELLKANLQERPTGAKATEAVAAGMSDTEAAAGLEPAQRKDILSDKDIEKEVTARTRGWRALKENVQFKDLFNDQEWQARVRKELQDERKRLLFNARRQVAEKVVTNAQTPGPAGQADRDTLLRLTKDVPGLEGLQRATPEQMKKDEEEADALDAQNVEIAESGKAAGRSIRRGLAEQKKRTARNIGLNARATERNLADNKKGIEDFRSGNEAIRKQEAARRKAEANRRKPANAAPPRGGIGGMIDRQRQVEASNLEANIMRQGGTTKDAAGEVVTRPGGMTPAQEKRLVQLEQQLGAKMPKFEETLQVMSMMQRGQNVNMSNIDAALAQSRRNLAENQRQAKAQNRPFADNGGN